MTDRLKAFVVTLDHDIREDDADPILSALRMVRGVLSVDPVTATMDDDIARRRVRYELEMKLIEAIRNK